MSKKVVKGKPRGKPTNQFKAMKEHVGDKPEDIALVTQLLGEILVEYRQPKVKSDDELRQRFDEYFQRCATTGQIPTIEELYMSTGYTYDGIYDWVTGRRKGFSPETAEIIKKARNFMRTFDAKLVTSGKLNFLTYCFRSKNYYGMVDKVEHVLTPNNPLGDVASTSDIQKRLEGGVAEDV